MREIKFRAWHKGQGDFPPQMLYDAWNGQCLYYAREGQPVELMQYTGLKDKNGKRIYEGDIVKGEFYIGDDIGLIKFGAHSIIAGHDDVLDSSIDAPAYGYFIDSKIGDEYPLVDTEDLEVIGNIYENPEPLGNKT